MSNTWKLSPSDLTFLWDECPRCFYLKVVRQFGRPRAPFPGIFGQIDRLMKVFFEGQPSSGISAELPDGAVRFGEMWVRSRPISFPHRASSCYIVGKFDTVVEFADSTFGIVDFKTSAAKPEHVDFYSRQLHAYAYALEHPAPGSLALSPVSKLGLLCVEPVNMDRMHDGQIAYFGRVTWLECPKDEEAFLRFLDSVVAVLEAPSPPDAGEKCTYCKYREDARVNGL